MRYFILALLFSIPLGLSAQMNQSLKDQYQAYFSLDYSFTAKNKPKQKKLNKLLSSKEKLNYALDWFNYTSDLDVKKKVWLESVVPIVKNEGSPSAIALNCLMIVDLNLMNTEISNLVFKDIQNSRSKANTTLDNYFLLLSEIASGNGNLESIESFYNIQLGNQDALNYFTFLHEQIIDFLPKVQAQESLNTFMIYDPMGNSIEFSPRIGANADTEGLYFQTPFGLKLPADAFLKASYHALCESQRIVSLKPWAIIPLIDEVSAMKVKYNLDYIERKIELNPLIQTAITAFNDTNFDSNKDLSETYFKLAQTLEGFGTIGWNYNSSNHSYTEVCRSCDISQLQKRNKLLLNAKLNYQAPFNGGVGNLITRDYIDRAIVLNNYLLYLESTDSKYIEEIKSIAVQNKSVRVQELIALLDFNSRGKLISIYKDQKTAMLKLASYYEEEKSPFATKFLQDLPKKIEGWKYVKNPTIKCNYCDKGFFPEKIVFLIEDYFLNMYQNLDCITSTYIEDQYFYCSDECEAKDERKSNELRKLSKKESEQYWNEQIKCVACSNVKKRKDMISFTDCPCLKQDGTSINLSFTKSYDIIGAHDPNVCSSKCQIDFCKTKCASKGYTNKY